VSKKSRINKIKSKIQLWREEGYNVDEIEKKVKTYEDHELNQKKEVGESVKYFSNNKKILAAIITIFIIAILVIYWNSGMMVPNTNETNENQQEELNLEFEAIRIVENLSQNSYQEVYQKFNDEMKNAISLNELQTAWESIIYQYGDYKEIKSTRKTEEYGYQIAYVTCDFETLGHLDIRIVFDENDMVAGLQFVPT